MNRRNFLKVLSSIPLIGIPVKALAKTPEVKKYGEYVQAGFDNVPDITLKNGSTITFTESSGETYVGSPHSDEYLMYADDPVPDDAVSLAKEKSGWNGIIESRSNVSLHKSKIDPYADVAEHIYKEYWNNSAEMNAAWLKRKS